MDLATQRFLQNAQNNFQGLQPQQQSRGGIVGFLEGAGKSIARPFVNTGRLAGEGLNLAASEITGTKFNPMFLNQQQMENLPEFAAGTLLQTGSYFVPGVGPVGGLANLATRGALGGALGAAGEQLSAQGRVDLGTVLTGGALGGALGGGAGLIGQGIRRAQGPTLQQLDDLIARQGDNALALGNTGPLGAVNARANAITNSDEILNNLFGRNVNASQRAMLADDLIKSPSASQLPSFVTDRLDEIAQSADNTGSGTFSGLGKRLVDNADNNVKGQFRRTLGKPSKELGSMKLYDDAQNLGILQVGDDLDSALAKTQQVLQEQGPVIGNAVEDLAGRGVTVDVKTIKQQLINQIDNVQSPSLKQPLQRALEELDAATRGADSIPINQFYALKQEIGSLGKWNQFAPPGEQQVSKAFNGIYTKMNDQLDNALKSNGMQSFREINKQLSTATKLQTHLENQVASQSGTKPLGFGEMISGVGGFAASGGNPLGAGAGIAFNKALTSNAANRAFIGAENRLGRALQNFSVPGRGVLRSQPIQQAVSDRSLQTVANVGGSLAGREAVMPQGGIQQNIPMVDNQMLLEAARAGYQPVQQQETGLDSQQLFALGLQLSGGDIRDALAIAQYFQDAQADQAGTQQKLTEKQGQFFNAAQSAQSALDLLLSGEAKTGKIANIENQIGGFLGTRDTAQTDYLSRLALARGVAMNALAGANISESEAKRIADSIPQATDEPAVARQKLQSFIDQMLQFSQVPQQQPTVVYGQGY